MTLITDIIISLLLIGAGIFALTAAIGLVKLKDCIQRLHAPTKAATLGVGGVLIASALHFTMADGALSFHELLIGMFILLTAPITANFIAKVYIEGEKRREDLPETGTEHGWAIYDDPPS